MSFEVEDLERLKLNGDAKLEDFLARWKVIVDELDGRVSQESLRDLLISKLSQVKGMEVPLGIFEAMGTSNPSYSYGGVLAACERFISKEQKERAKFLREDFLAGRNRAFIGIDDQKSQEEPVQRQRAPGGGAEHKTVRRPERKSSRQPVRNSSPLDTAAAVRRREMMKKGLCFDFNESCCDRPDCRFEHTLLTGQAGPQADRR